MRVRVGIEAAASMPNRKQAIRTHEHWGFCVQCWLTIWTRRYDARVTAMNPIWDGD